MEYESEETVMVRKTMKINLLDGGKSLQQAIRQIEQYKNDLSRKCEEICRRLSEIGVQVANTVLREGKLEDYQPSTKVSYEIDTSGNIVRAKIIISGPWKRYSLQWYKKSKSGGVGLWSWHISIKCSTAKSAV